jgi:uncharacterized protein (TIGR03083 family)
MIGADSIATVLEASRPERTRLLELLGGLAADEWAAPTECPLYSVKGIATHVLGDDLSLLSRQRDNATQGLLLVAEELPGADFRTLLDTFNDRWVAAARFLSADLLVELLRLAGEWTSSYYETVDPLAPCEPVGFFGSTGEPSRFWQAIAREYMERWVHHSQIRRALAFGSLAEESFVRVGAEVAASAAGVDATHVGGTWTLGPASLGSSQQTADILTRAHTADEIRSLVDGPQDAVDLLAMFAGRP